MNISYNWLKQYVDFSLSPMELADALTSIGLETGSVEEVESIKGGLKGIVIGRVLTCEPHPDSDHLHLTTVDLGGEAPVNIVCGAPNVAAGQTVVVATIGTTLYDGDKEFQIKKSKIRGHESFGMICAEDEIGVGNSHDGIIVINEDVKPGTPAAEYYGLTSDYILEVDLTPNRIDAASHFGVARDLAAWLAVHRTPSALKRPSDTDFAVEKPEGGIPVEVANTEACTRYVGITVRGVTVKESPQWLRDRLTTIGQRPINNIVDITNYILHGLGQPLHCFDLSKIKGGKVVVKTCKEGTKFTTLDGVEHTLSERDLMICNAEEPMCIAGVFGGLDSGVTDSTTDVFIESACFNPTWVRKTARRQGLSTDSSFRFERGVDPNMALYAGHIAALLVKELAGGEICGPVADVYPQPVAPYPVDFNYNEARRLIGKDIDNETLDRIMGLLEIAISDKTADKAHLEVPTYRYDVRRQCDVVEDILRIYGYNNVEISDEVHGCLSYRNRTDVENTMRRLISEQLTAAGFNEIMNNSLTAESYYRENPVWPIENCVSLLNPLSSDLGVMRQTLLFGGLETAVRNINRKESDLRLYEFGNVYRLSPEKESTAERPLAPYSEQPRLALWLSGNMRAAGWLRQADAATFYDLRATVANIFGRLGIDANEVKLEQVPADEMFSAGLTIARRNGKVIGAMSLVNRKLLAEKFDIKTDIFYADLDWNEIVDMAIRHNVSYQPLPKTLAVKRDLSLLIDSNVTMARIEEVVKKSDKKLLRSVQLFDVYEGKNLEPGKKSYAITMTLRDDEKTLQDKQIDAVMNKIITNLKRELGAELR